MHMPLWSDMFQLGLPIVEKILRPIVVYVFLIAGLRLAGKRELAQLNPLDLVVLLTLSNTVQNAIIGNDHSVTGGLIGAGTLLLVNYAVVRFLFSHPTVERLVEGVPAVLIEQGRIREDAMRRELITVAEVETAARKQGFPTLDDIDRALIDPGGTMSFFSKERTADAARYEAIITRLDRLSAQVEALRA